MDKISYRPVNLMPVPASDNRIVAEDGDSFIQDEALGSTVKRKKSNPSMYYGHIDFPVKNRGDWKRYAERFDASSPERLPQNLDQTLKQLNDSGDLVMFHLYPYMFRLGFYAMGMERFMAAFYDMPDLIHEMFDFWRDFTLGALKPFLGRVRIDLAACTEDYAYKTGPHLSPRIYREFFIPYQNAVFNELKKHGVTFTGVWTAGNADIYIPILMENGVNCLLILEQQAGMDPIKLRQKYGKNLTLIGGIAKEALIAGPDALDYETNRLAPLMAEGGYIPAIDDMVPPEVPFKHFVHYVESIQNIKL